MKKTLALLIGSLTFLILSESLTAQVCWMKFNPENCKYRLITEFGISKRLNDLMPNSDPNNYRSESTSINVDLNFGMDVKIREKIAIGGVLFADYDQFFRTPRYGIRPRISYFPNNHLDLNFSPGFILGSGNSLEYSSGGISLEAGVNYKNYVGLFSRLDFPHRIDSQQETSFNIGIKAAGPAGLVSTGGCILVGGAASVLLIVLLIAAIGGG